MGEINHEKEHFSLSVTDIWQLSWKSLSQSPNSDRGFFSGCQNISNCPSIEIFRFGELLLTIIVNFKKLNKWSFFSDLLTVILLLLVMIEWLMFFNLPPCLLRGEFQILSLLFFHFIRCFLYFTILLFGWRNWHISSLTRMYICYLLFQLL